MKKYYFLLSFLFVVSITTAQYSSGFGRPFANPTPPSVYSFTKYGDIPVNEYRGIANITIPLYDIKIDDVDVPLNLSYFSGGIKVAEEAGIVGLGWDMNMPSVIQTIKDEDDFKPGMKFSKLPDYVGNINYTIRGNKHPWITGYGSTEGMAANSTSINFLDEPSYFISSGNFVIVNNQYNQSVAQRYDDFFNSEYLDSEPDIFKVSINGVELVIMRSAESVNQYSQFLNEIIQGNTNPLKIINGREEYKVKIVDGSLSLDSGIMITDPNGNQYYFQNINTINGASSNEGFLQSHYGGPGLYYKPQYRIFNLSKIITSKNKEITFSYDSNTVNELYKFSQSYYKRIGNVNTNGQIIPEDFYDLKNSFINVSNPNSYTFLWSDSGITFFKPDNSDIGISSNYYYQNQKFNFLTSIKTPNEQINFSYSAREDYEGMKKVDYVEINNVLNQTIKKYNFNYDYFNSNDCQNCSTYKNYRLKLISVGLDGDSPYMFEYNTTPLPNKSSFSVDYWGYYNGSNNTSFLLSLPAMGYSQYNGQSYTDNNQNNFNASLENCKAGILEKIIYPTKGYTVFDYQLNTFDSYLRPTDINTPTITIGAGLRINRIDNYSDIDVLSNTTKYNYFKGKTIFKKQLARMYNLKVLDYNEVESYTDTGVLKTYDSYSTTVLELSLSNYLSSSVIGSEDYVGYDRVEKSESFKGKISKEYFNNPYQIYNCIAVRNFTPMYFTKRNDIQNGSVLKESIYDENDILKQKNEYAYTLRTSNQKRYGVSINKYDSFICIRGAFGNTDERNMPSFLMSFYPIFSNSTLLSSNKITDYYPSGSKWGLTSFQYNSDNLITQKETRDQFGNYFKNESTWYSPNTTQLNKNILSLPMSSLTIENELVKNKTDFIYDDTEFSKVIRAEEHINGGSADEFTHKIYYDRYDDKGNILEYHLENGIYTSIIWGYRQTLPIAKIENIRYSDLEPYIGTIQNISNQLYSQLANFRTTISSQFPNAMITTFTHIPLVGVETITDPKGKTNTYTYDSLNRLQYVKDNDGNILSENEYHFRP
jgi:YD repeat-containing protein